jgi:hypothetical protein
MVDGAAVHHLVGDELVLLVQEDGILRNLSKIVAGRLVSIPTSASDSDIAELNGYAIVGHANRADTEFRWLYLGAQQGVSSLFARAFRSARSPFCA